MPSKIEKEMLLWRDLTINIEADGDEFCASYYNGEELVCASYGKTISKAIANLKQFYKGEKE